MRAIRREKIPAEKIQTHRQMPAAILIGDKLALKPRQKSFGRTATPTLEGKLHRFPFLHLIRPRDFDFRHFASL